MIQYHQNDAESMSGTKSFSQGLGSQSLGSVAAGIRSTLDATAKRELSILRRLSEQLFKDLADERYYHEPIFSRRRRGCQNYK